MGLTFMSLFKVLAVQLAFSLLCESVNALLLPPPKPSTPMSPLKHSPPFSPLKPSPPPHKPSPPLSPTKPSPQLSPPKPSFQPPQPKPSPTLPTPKPSPALSPPKHSTPLLPPKSSPPLSPPRPGPTLLPPPPSPFGNGELVAVQGFVYCSSCKQFRSKKFMIATPLTGAVVKLECKNSKPPVTVSATTGNKGYFLLQAQKSLSKSDAFNCRVFLVSSPSSLCKVATKANKGATGAQLKLVPKQPTPPSPYTLYTVGSLAFAPDLETCKKWG